jgi:hypothetical protein
MKDGIYELKGTERMEQLSAPVDCGEARITRYFDERNVMVRQDVEIIVDPEKLPKMGGVAGEV